METPVEISDTGSGLSLFKQGMWVMRTNKLSYIKRTHL